jgi:2-iminobutanoate/2-iminopropanoate deaminase
MEHCCMGKTLVQTTMAPAAIGPYSQAIKHNGFLFVSGQIPLDPQTGELIKGSIEDETRRVLKNLQGVIEAAGATLKDVVKTTIFLRSMSDFARVNEVYGSFFPAPYPARSTVAVAGLPKDVSVEIEAIVAV